jgi:hypothetical protein
MGVAILFTGNIQKVPDTMTLKIDKTQAKIAWDEVQNNIV